MEVSKFYSSGPRCRITEILTEETGGQDEIEDISITTDPSKFITIVI